MGPLTLPVGTTVALWNHGAVAVYKNSVNHGAVAAGRAQVHPLWHTGPGPQSTRAPGPHTVQPLLMVHSRGSADRGWNPCPRTRVP